MIPPETQRVLDFLASTLAYPHLPAEVRRLQTHASWLFIASPFVYKMKKPVNFGFLDFSTLEKRREDCKREVVLNRRLAVGVYLDVLPVCDTSAGLRLIEGGPPVEWLVLMREMDQEGFLSHRLRHGHVTRETIDAIAACLREFYRTQPPLPASEAALACRRVAGFVQDNFTCARRFIGQSVSLAALAAIERFSTVFENHHRELLASRAADGWIRDCHGDLHCEHIHLSGAGVQIYDCIEFNTEFRHIDIACDLAFLAMDLDFYDRPDLAHHLVDDFSNALEDSSLERLMNFHKCYRACVRGKVESLHSAGDTVPEDERAASLALARRYFQLALRYAIGGSRPSVWVFMGRVASGKSTLAEAVSRETGWRVESSDCLRKNLAGVPLNERGTAAERALLYSKKMTQRVYDGLLDAAMQETAKGHSII
ncbi:hypothetical protein, partial [Prosthecobacter sp.]|uniref:bifunctional aminoglycoside phosphotransferase/ATP-binding protein n=1 Tax=Prosthecobacter sp. TaxID=1965333 RepID=UPI001E07D6C2